MLVQCVIFAIRASRSLCSVGISKYTPRRDADLIQVHIISRHGARSPLHAASNFSNAWICNYTEFIGDTEAAVHVSVAHGRSETGGTCLPGQLTEFGAYGANMLGKYVRDTYIHKMKLLPSEYRPSTCKFRSTNTVRTIHSQMNLFKGLYPGDQQMIINTADKLFDPWRRTSVLCPKVNDIIKSLKGGEEWQSLGLEDKELMDNLTTKLGTKWDYIDDVLVSAACKRMPLPDGVSERVLEAATSLRARQMQYIYTHDSVFPLFASFSAAEILNEMEKRISGESSTKFVHWSAHDGNILSFLGYLGVSDGIWPRYASFLTVELWKFRKLKLYFIQFRYNGEILRIPRFSHSRIIPFDDYRKFMNNFMPKIEEECGFSAKNLAERSVFMPEAV